MTTVLILAVLVVSLASAGMTWKAMTWIDDYHQQYGKAVVRIEATTNGLKEQGDINTVIHAKTLELSTDTAAAQKLLLVIVDKQNALAAETSDETLTLLRELVATKGQA